MTRNLTWGTDRTSKPLSVPCSTFFSCPTNVARTASPIPAYARSFMAFPWKNPIPLSTQSVAVVCPTTCRTMNAPSVIGKVLRRKLRKIHVPIKQHRENFTCEEFQEFRTFFMTCTCGWRTPIKIMEGRFLSYYLQNLWESHSNILRRKESQTW